MDHMMHRRDFAERTSAAAGTLLTSTLVGGNVTAQRPGCIG